MAACAGALALVAMTGCRGQCALESLQKGLTVLIRSDEEGEPLPEGSYLVEARDGEAHELSCAAGETPPCSDAAVGDDAMLILEETPDGLSLLWIESRGDVVGGPVEATIRVFRNGEMLIDEELEPEYERDVHSGGADCGIGEHASVELLF
jgi:hypothetical protein